MADTPLLDKLNAQAGTGQKRPRWATVGKGFSGKGGAKRKGVKTQASARCGLNSFKGVK